MHLEGLAEGEVLQLRWENYSKTLGGQFKDMKEKGQFLDVTLISEDKKRVEAHKVVEPCLY